METNEKELTGYPSIDKPWLKYYSEEALNAPLPECTVYENIYNRNRNNLNDIALVYYGKKITYKKLFDNITKTKKALEHIGVKKGDIVILLASSTPEIIYTILALCRIGAIANLINPLFNENDMIERINETKSKVLVVLDKLYGKICNIKSNLCTEKIVITPVSRSMPMSLKAIFNIREGFSNIKCSNNIILWDNFIKTSNKSVNLPDAEYIYDRPFLMVYSSGTTGSSKGIVLTNDGINATINHYDSDIFPYNKGERFLQIIPIWFSTGIVLSVFMPLCMDITVVLEPVYNEKVFIKDIIKYKPNMILESISKWIYLIKCDEIKDIDLSFIDYAITGGEKVLETVETKINLYLEEHNCKAKLLKGYGMCELGSTITTDSKIMIKPNAVGFPISKVTVSIFDTTTNKEKKYNERGEIRVLSPAHMKEYYNNIEATNKFFYVDEKGNKWGCTGDIGYIDSEGFLYILGRINDSYLSSYGKIVYCFDVESVIMRNINVQQCKVVGKNNGNGYFSVAHIVKKECFTGSNEDLINQIHSECKEVLKPYELPYAYKIREYFPVKNNVKMDIEALINDDVDLIYVEKTFKNQK